MVLSGHEECVYMGKCCGNWCRRRDHVRQFRARPDPAFLFHFLIVFATNHSTATVSQRLGVHAEKGAKRRGSLQKMARTGGALCSDLQCSATELASAWFLHKNMSKWRGSLTKPIDSVRGSPSSSATELASASFSFAVVLLASSASMPVN